MIPQFNTSTANDQMGGGLPCPTLHQCVYGHPSGAFSPFSGAT